MLQKSSCFSLQRCLHTTPICAKRALFKPKIAKARPNKTASMLALDNFDFYYGPLFGDQWPSIRLGLLTPNKFVAVLNRFSEDVEVNERILRELGSSNVIDYLTAGKNVDDMKVEKKKKVIDAKPIVDDEGRPVSEQTSTAQQAEIPEETEFQGSRLEGGIHEFNPPTSEYDRGVIGSQNDAKNRKLNKIEITGVERFGANLHRKEDFLLYPRNLFLFSYPRGSILDYPSPIKDQKNISSWWLLDGGSVLPVLALNLKETDNVLDLCAAPGGKSLLIAQTGLFEKLTCNDSKLSRIGQLRRGLSMYIPPDVPEAEKIVIKRKDASLLDSWNEEGIYDKVLVDAPCTTDRLAVNQDEGNMFSSSMTQVRLGLPQLQVKLLVNALRSVKVGGQVVYATCSLSPMQNDAVVENAAVIAEQQFGIHVIEKTLVQLQRHLQPSGLYRFSPHNHRGILVVPWLPSNFGPMYLCKLERTK